MTLQQLQLAATQGVSAWRAAGIDSPTLSNLDQVTIHLANLPGAELGFTSGGEIWIDQTAAGWGWDVNGGVGMDLLTVLSHELGHVLGFEHSGTSVMEAALAPGVIRVPGALAASAAVSSGSVVSAGSLAVVAPTTFPTVEASSSPSLAFRRPRWHARSPSRFRATGVHNAVAPGGNRAR